MCMPNENITDLLEFCYSAGQIQIVKGLCAFLYPHSTMDVYSCHNFTSGCPTSGYRSQEVEKYRECVSIGNGCFLAEPSCVKKRRNHKDMEKKHLEQIVSIAASVLGPIILIIIIIIIICCIIKSIQLRKRRDDEERQTETASEHSLLIQTDKRDDVVLIEQGIQLRKSDDEEQHTETTSELLPLIQTDKRDNAVLIEQVNEEEKKKKETLAIQGNKEEEKEDEEKGEEEEHSISIKINQHDITGTIAKESPVDRAIFMQWQDDNRQFVSTRACKEVEKLIKSQNLVVVTGNSGSGKSAIIQHIALCFRSQGWKVKPVYNVKEIADTYSSVDGSQSRLLFVFNDPIGHESFDEIAYNSWKEHDERLKAFLKNSKMLLSSRKYILLDDRVKGMLNDKSCSIDLSDDKHKLNNEEKKNILMSYSSNSGLLKDDINGILMTEEYFPLLCKLYFSDKNNQTIGPRFFKEPFNVCREQIRNFRKDCKENYCALVLLVLCNNQLCVEDIHKDDRLREKSELALKLCEMKTNTAPHTIGDTLKNLEGFFVKKIGDTYHFYHDFVMEVTTFVFGTDYPTETIQYADIGFLRRRVNLKSSDDNRNEEVDKFTIYLNDKYVSDLADRLFNDVFGDRLLDVVLNPCMRNEKVAKCFIQKLKESPEKLHDLLAKKQLHEKFRRQEENQELKQSFGSKLEFLIKKDKVQILSAIIVFCHTNVSKHCLETLQGMQNFLKYTSFFTAVCCNGSMDLFNVFPKEQIKWFI